MYEDEMPKKHQFAVRVPHSMAAAVREAAWELDRKRGNPEASGFIQRWLYALVVSELERAGYWPANEKTYAGTAPRSPHPGRRSNAQWERRFKAQDERIEAYHARMDRELKMPPREQLGAQIAKEREAAFAAEGDSGLAAALFKEGASPRKPGETDEQWLTRHLIEHRERSKWRESEPLENEPEEIIEPKANDNDIL